MFITLEGIDGTGKSTQAGMLVEKLTSLGHDVLWTREPGGWSNGPQLRKVLLEGSLSHPATESLLFIADRCEHVSQVILPALEKGQWVVCERYNDSTLAYQCWGRGINRKRIEMLISWCNIPDPDITFWLNLPPSMALERARSRSAPDRIEREHFEFHCRLAEGFATLARENPGRIEEIDASCPPGKVASQIDEVLRRRLLL